MKQQPLEPVQLEAALLTLNPEVLGLQLGEALARRLTWKESMSNFICTKCKQQRVKGTLGQKHACGGTFVTLLQAEKRIPRAHMTERAAQGKGVLRPKKG